MAAWIGAVPTSPVAEKGKDFFYANVRSWRGYD